MPISFRARVVFPVDRPPIEHGVLTIEGERIVGVGTNLDGGEMVELGSVALLPGLVNAHTHLEFSELSRPLGKPGMRLADWIRLVIATRGRDTQALTASIEAGQRESLRGGVTTLGEIGVAYLPHPLDQTIFVEVIGFSRARAASALSLITEQMESLPSSAAQLFDKYGKSFERKLRFGVSPHAPYTVSPGLLEQLVRLASEHDAPVAMHIAESVEELEFLQSGTGAFQELLDERSMWDHAAVPRGSRPLDYLRMLSTAPRAMVIHGNFLVADELAFLGANREWMSLVYCPRTHAYFRHPPYPLAKAIENGVRVALGTDSRASNPDLDLLAEMRFVVRSHPAIDPSDVLLMGTLAGAEALGRDEEVGSLTTGKLANMLAVPLPADVRSGQQELLTAILSSELPVSDIWVRGERKVMTAS